MNPMRRAQILLFLSVFLSLAAIDHTHTGWNINSRLDLVFAVVEEGTFRIDTFHDTRPTKTMDKSIFGGHYYSDKAIGVSALAVPPYAAMRVIWRLFGAEPSFRQANYLLRVVVVSSAAGISAVLLLNLLVLLGAEARRAVLAVAFIVFGTLFYGYASVFYPYVPGIASGLLALWLIVAPATGRLTRRGSFAIGSLCGLALLCDFIFGIIIAGLATLYLVRLASEAGWLSLPSAATVFPRKYDGKAAAARLGLGFLGGAIVLSIFTAYTYAIFGHIAIPYEYHAVPEYRTGMQQGIMGIEAPRIDALWFLTLHPLRGLFFWSPVLLFALAGCLHQLRSPGLTRMLGILGLYSLLGYLLFNSSYYMWWGGWAMGPRLLLPIFIAFPLGLATFCQSNRSPMVWKLVVALGVASILLSLPISLIDPQVDQHFLDSQFRSFEIGDSIEVPAIRKLLWFYRFDWLFANLDAPIPRLLAWGSAGLIPAVLISLAIRCLPGRVAETRATSRE
jgi:hypothetical protein